MANIEKIVIRLDAENSRLTRSLEKSQRDLSKFERGATRSINKFSSVAKVAFGAASVGFFVAATKASLDYADSIDKMSKVAGISAEKLQELRFAGNQLGVSTKEIDEGMRRFGRRLGKLANDDAGPAKVAMDKLGISVEDTKGKFRGVEVIFDDVVRAMEGVESQAQLSALAAELFGDDAGPKLALLLQQGIAGLNSFADEARSIGIILDDDLIAGAVDAKDELDKLGKVIKVQVTAALLNLKGPIIAVTGLFLDLTKAANKAFGGIGSTSDTSVIEARISELLEKVESAKARLARSQEAEEGNSAMDFLVRVGGLARPEDIQKEVDSIEAELVAAYARLSKVQFVQPEGPTVPESAPGAKETAKKASAAPSPVSAAAVEQALPGQREWNALIKEAATLTQALRTPTEAYYDDVSKYKDLLDRQLISQETFTRGVEESWDRVGAAAEETTNEMSEFAIAAARSMQGAFSDGIFNIMQGEGGFEDLADTFKRTIDRMVADMLSSQLLDMLSNTGSGAAGGGGGNAIFGAIGQFLTGKAAGGPVAANQPYLVGEKGPELFVPKSSGNITPNNRLGGSITVIQNVTTPDINSFRHSSRQLAQDQSRLLGQARASA